MTDAEVWASVADERVALADLLEGVAPEAWETPSRCEGWTVKDVVAHLVFLAEGTVSSVFLTSLRTHPLPSRALAEVARRSAASTPTDELVDRLRRAAAGRFVVPGLPPTVALGEVLVHRADLAAAAGLPPHAADERLAAVLEAEQRLWFAFGVTRQVRRLRFEPTDADWSVGPDGGPAVVGPGEDLLLVATGRDVDPGAVSGPGLAVLGR